jgi:hypothetical protein
LNFQLAMKKNIGAYFAGRWGRSKSIVVWAVLTAVGFFFFIFRFFSPPALIGDQTATGNVAAGLADGWAASPWSYQYVHLSGTVLFGVLLYPLYALCGSSFFWVSLLSGLFVAGGVALWTLAVRRGWGPRAALIFFLWIVFPPPFLEPNYHVAYAGHIESLFFSGLLLFLFARLDKDRPGVGETAAFGAIAGLGVFFSQENLTIAAAAAVAAVWRWRGRGARRLVWPGALAFLLGYAPGLLSYAMPLRFSAVYQPSLAMNCWAKWRELFAFFLPGFAGYSGRAGAALSLSLPLVAALGAVAAWRKPTGGESSRGDKIWLARILLLHFVFFVLAYGFTGWSTSEGRPSLDAGMTRYLAPVYFLLFAYATFFLLRLGRYGQWLLLAPFLIAGLVNLVSGTDFTGAAVARGYRYYQARRGDDYLEYVYSGLPRAWTDRRSALRTIGRLPRRWRDDGCISLGERLTDEEFRAAMSDDTLPVAARQDIALGAGVAFAARAGVGFADHNWGSLLTTRWLPPDRPPIAVSSLRGLDVDVAGAFVAGFGRGLGERKTRMFVDVYLGKEPLAELQADFRANADLIRADLPQLRDEEFQSLLRRGTSFWMGRGLGRELFLGRNLDLNEALIAQIDRLGERLWATQAVGSTRDEIRENVAAGVAAWLRNDYNRFPFAALGAESPLVREALLAQGVGVKQTANDAGEDELEPLP